MLQGIADYLKLGQTTAVAAPAITPQDFALLENYPNPVGSGHATVINYRVARATPVRLVLYDAVGRQIRILHESAAPGNYQIQLDAKSLNSGVYFYRLQTNTGSLTRRLLIVR